jgi:hypothetical protein
MNAPLTRNTIEKRLLLAANEELETVYNQTDDPCVALLISRNYNLLTQQPEDIDLRIAWMQKAKYWWQQYLKQTTGKYVDFGFLVQEALVFKCIDL